MRKLSRAQSRGVLKGVWREEDDTDVEHMLHRIQARLARWAGQRRLHPENVQRMSACCTAHGMQLSECTGTGV